MWKGSASTTSTHPDKKFCLSSPSSFDWPRDREYVAHLLHRLGVRARRHSDPDHQIRPARSQRPAPVLQGSKPAFHSISQLLRRPHSSASRAPRCRDEPRSQKHVAHSSPILAQSAHILCHSVNILSHSAQILAYSVYILSHSVHILAHSTHILSHSVHILSHSVRILSHSAQIPAHCAQRLPY